MLKLYGSEGQLAQCLIDLAKDFNSIVNSYCGRNHIMRRAGLAHQISPNRISQTEIENIHRDASYHAT